MRLNTQPSRRVGMSKCIFSAPIQAGNVQINENGEVTISITADDIYTKNSKQRYEIILTGEEISILSAAS